MTLEPGESHVPPRRVEDVHAEYRREEPWAQALYEHRPVIFDLSRAKLVGMVALCSSFVVGGLLLVLVEPPSYVAGLLGLIIGVCAGTYWVRMLVFATAAIRVDALGVHVRAGQQDYPWHEIAGAATWRQNHNHFVGLMLTESACASRYGHRSKMYRRVRRVRLWPHGENTVILPHPVALDRDRLTHWLGMEAVYRNVDIRRQIEAELAGELSPPSEHP
ncbi:MAG: hypothetical protein ACJ72P_15735 [Nocardioides sp.]